MRSGMRFGVVDWKVFCVSNKEWCPRLVLGQKREVRMKAQSADLVL